MTKAKEFVGVSSIVSDGLVKYLCASNGQSVANANGITLDEALNFILQLHLDRRRSRRVLVCFGFAYTLEHLFAQLPNGIKDRLFTSSVVRSKIEGLELELAKIDQDLHQTAKDSPLFMQLSFERSVNLAALDDLTEINYNGFTITLQAGKRLSIRRAGKQAILFDIFSFFKKPLPKAWLAWFGERNAVLANKGIKLPLDEYCAKIEAKCIATLTADLDKELLACGIALTSYHGAGAIASWMLRVSGARDKQKPQYYTYKHTRQVSSDLHKAVLQSYYAGRIEQVKTGTFTKDIYVYDINSAYAYATSLLPYLLRKPTRARSWSDEPFSLWHCEYDFTELGLPFGLLPHRNPNSSIVYKLRGSGYYWQPEIAYLLENFPQCVKIGGGYTIPYERAPFTDIIQMVYDMRRTAKKPLASILKVGLASVYGKFCQSYGNSYYSNMFYAGFITSVTRRQMLQAVKGMEAHVICFLTDAIHTTEQLAVPVSDRLGDYKRNDYVKGEYIDVGIYRLTQEGGEYKTASQGFKDFDFDAAMAQFNEKNAFDVLMQFFVTYNLFSISPITQPDYLQIRTLEKRNNPLNSTSRIWKRGKMDLLQGAISSAPRFITSARESSQYRSHQSDLSSSRDVTLARGL